MMQEPTLSDGQLNKSDIACKGLTAAGASLLASEMVLGGDGREGNLLSTARRSTVGVALNPRGGAADGSDQATAIDKSTGEHNTCTVLV